MQWRNVPIPDFYVVFFILGPLLHRLVPWTVFSQPRLGQAIGWPMVAAGLLLAGWAVQTSNELDLEKPAKLVTTGPYAVSRNPMYAAWTLIYAGVALVANTNWLVLFLPGVLLLGNYVVIRREERDLERAFGDEYQRYRARVRRWL
ncbi:MAG: hypothetical protein CL878_01890 [Dehalococcoidia bacterium]|nr:hypothetical protein [Dehalococcoidia bacterium]